MSGPTPAEVAWQDQERAVYAEADAQATDLLERREAVEMEELPVWIIAPLRAAAWAVTSGLVPARPCRHIQGPMLVATTTWAGNRQVCRPCEAAGVLELPEAASHLCDPCGRRRKVVAVHRLLDGPVAIHYRLCRSCLAEREATA